MAVQGLGAGWLCPHCLWSMGVGLGSGAGSTFWDDRTLPATVGASPRSRPWLSRGGLAVAN